MTFWLAGTWWISCWTGKNYLRTGNTSILQPGHAWSLLVTSSLIFTGLPNSLSVHSHHLPICLQNQEQKNCLKRFILSTFPLTITSAYQDWTATGLSLRWLHWCSSERVLARDYGLPNRSRSSGNESIENLLRWSEPFSFSLGYDRNGLLRRMQNCVH